MMKYITAAICTALLIFPSVSIATAASQPATVATKSQLQQETVNINTADVQTLTRLKGVGQKKAEAIVAWRKANGNFKRVEQFAEVKGIGPALLEANRSMIRIE